MGDELKEIKDHIKHQLAKGYKPDEIRRALVGAGFSSQEVSEAFRPFEPKRTPLLHKLFKPKKKEKKIEAKKKPEKKAKAGKKGPLTGKRPSEEKRPLLHRIFKPVPMPEFPKKEEQQLLLPAPEEVKQPEETEAEEMPKLEPLPTYEEPEERIELSPPPASQVIHRGMRTYMIIILAVIIFTAAVLFLFSPAGCITEECFMEKANKCEPAKFKNTIKGTVVSYEANNCVLTKKILSLEPEEPQEIVDAFMGKNMTCRYQMNNFNPLYLTTITGLLNTCEGELKTAVLQYAV